MTHNTTPGPFLVTENTGTAGRRVTTLLRERGHEARSASRSSEHHFDWLDRSTWGPTLAGAGAWNH
jgi:uncharacterized protein YbjT (DUF2867 family)